MAEKHHYRETNLILRGTAHTENPGFSPIPELMRQKTGSGSRDWNRTYESCTVHYVLVAYSVRLD